MRMRAPTRTRTTTTTTTTTTRSARRSNDHTSRRLLHTKAYCTFTMYVTTYMCCNNDGYLSSLSYFRANFGLFLIFLPTTIARGDATLQMFPGVGGSGWPIVHYFST